MTNAYTRLPASTPPADLAVVLLRDGAVVIEGLTSDTTALQIDRELSPHAERRAPGYETHEEFWGSRTKRFQGLPMKSATFVDAIMLNPTILGIADEVLGPNCGDYWISQTEAIFIGPGENAQELHRDDVNWAHALPLGFPVQFSVLTAIGDYDAEVGATVAILGSHAWARDTPVNPALAQPIELALGDGVVYLGSILHGGGHNATSDRWRKAVYCGFLLGWLTPEEASALSVTPAAAAGLPPRARQLLGWSSQHGTRETEGVDGAMQLWQLDRDDRERYGESYGFGSAPRVTP